MKTTQRRRPSYYQVREDVSRIIDDLYAQGLSREDVLERMEQLIFDIKCVVEDKTDDRNINTL